MSQPTSVVVTFGDDATIKDASASQIKQGSAAFLRSASLTVAGEPIQTAQGYRLTADALTALVDALTADPTVRTATLPLGKRGRPTQGRSLFALIPAQTPATAPAKGRRVKGSATS